MNLESWLKRDPDLFDPSYSPCERCLCEDWGAKLNEEVLLCGLVSLVIDGREEDGGHKVRSDDMHAVSSSSPNESIHLLLCSSGSTLLICSRAGGNGLRGFTLLLREVAGALVWLGSALRMLSRRSG